MENYRSSSYYINTHSSINTPTSYTSTSARSTNTTNHQQLNPHNVNFDPDHPSFYRQFSRLKSPEERAVALEAVKTITFLQLATLHFISESCDEFHTVILKSMHRVFSLGTSKQKGTVFIHLMQSIAKLQYEFELPTNVYTTVREIRDRMLITNLLRSSIQHWNTSNFFTGMDISARYLRYLDIEELKLTFQLNLSKSNFNDGFFAYLNFGNTLLDGATFKNINRLSEIMGDHYDSHRWNISDEQQDSDSSEQEKERRNNKCIIS